MGNDGAPQEQARAEQQDQGDDPQAMAEQAFDLVAVVLARTGDEGHAGARRRDLAGDDRGRMSGRMSLSRGDVMQ